MAKRNGKTKPPQQRARVFGENDPDDSFVPPDRNDTVATNEGDDNQPVETINFKTGAAELQSDEDKELADTAAAAARDKDANESPEPRRAERPVRQERSTRRADAQDDQDDRGALSKAMRKRINRERAIANRERALREQSDKQLKDERVARQALDDRLIRIERTQKQVDTNGDLRALKVERDALVPMIAAATEAGETKKALELQIKHGELQGRIGIMEYDIKLRSENAQAIEAREKQERDRRQAEGDTSRQIPAHELAENQERIAGYKKSNRFWTRKGDNSDAFRIQGELDQEILDGISAGEYDFKPYSEEHFQELADQLHEEFPDLELCDPDGVPYEFDGTANEDDTRGDRRPERAMNERQQNGRPPAGRGGTRNGGRRAPDIVEQARQGKVTLTAEDFKTMRIYKLDPNNPKDKVAYAKERARSIISEASRGDR